MNKQLTKKSIGIAASAALIATLAVSGSAFAHHNNSNHGNSDDNNGQKSSIEILSICDLKTISGNLNLKVWTKIVDTSSESAYGAELDSLFVQAYEKVGTGKWQYTNKLGTASAGDLTEADDFSFDDCRSTTPADSCNEVSASASPSACARSVNADIEVLIDGIHNNKEIRYDCENDEFNPDGTCVGKILGGPWSVFTANCSDDPLTDANEMASLNVWNKAACN